MSTSIRVVVADESPFVCRLLTTHLHSSPDIQVVGTARTGPRALELVKSLRPAAATLAMEMPGMNGLQTLERIMQECPTPVILVTGVSREAARVTLRALELGAVDFVLKYTPGADTNPDTLRRRIVSTVRTAAGVKVIRLLGGPRRSVEATNPVVAVPAGEPRPRRLREVVVIGASTGGPVALRELLSRLPADFVGAVLVVQHLPASFTGVFAEQLTRQVALPVKEAEDGDRLEPGRVLIAPGGLHLLVQPDERVSLNDWPEVGGHRPSVDVTMQSAARVYGPRVRGVLLTGMGEDGARGMVAIKAHGGQTFAQDAASCVVNGMPQRAVDAGAVDVVAPPAELARLLVLASALPLPRVRTATGT
jgi:two-component system, chemotaxis family, protein-glutamate methylesterase/glutaminase